MLLPFAAVLLHLSALFQSHPVQHPGLHVRAGGNRVGLFDTTKVTPTGESLAFSSGFGGSGTFDNSVQGILSDVPQSVALDANGNIYLAGTMFSTDFPLIPAPAAPPTTCSPCPDAGVFVSKLDPNGKNLVYSKYFTWQISHYPGLPAAIAVDSSGNLYLTGTSPGANFPQVGATANSAGGRDAFLIKLDPNGKLLAAALFGGSGDDAGTSIALGADGKLYLAGTTASANFPVTPGAFRTSPSGAQNIFLMKIDPAQLSGNTLAPGAVLYSTYVGPGSTYVGPNGALALAVDSSGGVYIAASTTSPDWPIPQGAFQQSCVGSTCGDVIVARIAPGGGQLTAATFLGGSRLDSVSSIALDASGSVYVAGRTDSTDFPTTAGAFQTHWAGFSPSAYAAKLSPDLNQLVYSTYLEGSVDEAAQGIVVDSSGNAYVGGSTDSPDFPVLNALQPALTNKICSISIPDPTGSGPSNYFECRSGGFLTALTPDGSALRWSTYLGGGYVSALTLDSGGNVYAAGVNIDVSGAKIAGTSTSVSVAKIQLQGQPLQFSDKAITDGASFHPGLPRPGGLASLFVSGLNTTGTIIPSGYPLPTTVAGLTILVKGVPSPILAIANLPSGGQQVDFQVPFEAAGSAAPFLGSVEVRYNGVSTFAFPQSVAPGIFTLGDGSGAVQHASDYSLVTPSNPAKPGEIIVVYATGLGPVKTPVGSGVPAPGPDPYTGACNPLTASVGQILYAGLTPGFVGLYQVNMQLSSSLPSGVADLHLNFAECWLGTPPINYYQSNSVPLPVQ